MSIKLNSTNFKKKNYFNSKNTGPGGSDTMLQQKTMIQKPQDTKIIERKAAKKAHLNKLREQSRLSREKRAEADKQRIEAFKTDLSYTFQYGWPAETGRILVASGKFAGKVADETVKLTAKAVSGLGLVVEKTGEGLENIGVFIENGSIYVAKKAFNLAKNEAGKIFDDGTSIQNRIERQERSDSIDEKMMKILENAGMRQAVENFRNINVGQGIYQATLAICSADNTITSQERKVLKAIFKLEKNRTPGIIESTLSNTGSAIVGTSAAVGGAVAGVGYAPGAFPRLAGEVVKNIGSGVKQVSGYVGNKGVGGIASDAVKAVIKKEDSKPSDVISVAQAPNPVQVPRVVTTPDSNNLPSSGSSIPPQDLDSTSVPITSGTVKLTDTFNATINGNGNGNGRVKNYNPLNGDSLNQVSKPEPIQQNMSQFDFDVIVGAIKTLKVGQVLILKIGSKTLEINRSDINAYYLSTDTLISTEPKTLETLELYLGRDKFQKQFNSSL